MAESGGETQWIQGAVAGDKDSFCQLVMIYQKRAYSLAFRLLKDPGAAEDVAQEAFCRAWLSISRFVPERPFASWILRIVYRLAINRSRLSARQAHPTGALDGLKSKGPDDPERSAENRDTFHRLECALETMEEGARSMFLLHHMEGMSIRDIAAIVERPEGTVKTILFRTRKQLRLTLGLDGD